MSEFILDRIHITYALRLFCVIDSALCFSERGPETADNMCYGGYELVSETLESSAGLTYSWHVTSCGVCD